jgi:glycosyltransferase involved in cell wall biosynthesis
MKKVIHIITTLGSGGAENMLYKLLKHSNREVYYHEVISLMDEGVYGENIEKLGVKVHCLNLNKKNVLSSILKTKELCKEFDVVNTWLYHADILGFLVGKVLLRKKLIWNIRHSNLDKNANKVTTLKIVKINAFLSRFVDCITYNSNKAVETHKQVGYLTKNFLVIPNGFELNKFKFNAEDRISIRNNLGISDKEKVIITVGRWDIQKDYFTLLKSLEDLKTKTTKFKMLMVGSRLDYSNQELKYLIDKHQLNKNVILLGRRDDIPAILSAADIYVSSSLGESFSNSIGEAMACELPCVVTDVGDSRLIVGDTGDSVEAGDYKLLSNKLLENIKSVDLNARSKKSRQRVISQYNIEVIAKKYDKVFNNTILIQ